MRVALPRTRSWGLSCIPRPVRQLAASLAWLSLLALPKAADACSYATVVIESSYPEAGARDVPTNAMLFASVHWMALASAWRRPMAHRWPSKCLRSIRAASM